MKRGRPSIRNTMLEAIVQLLSQSQVPLTISVLAKQSSQILNRRISWNTVQKYLQELVELNKVQPLILPHSKKENEAGLTVYMLKK